MTPSFSIFVSHPVASAGFVDSLFPVGYVRFGSVRAPTKGEAVMETLRTPDGVPFVRTPDAAFSGLADYPFSANFVAFEHLRLHYLDIGPRDAPTALLLHGMPTWSYLYRHIIAVLIDSGWRCVAPDHIGFGKSDKVTDEGWYGIARHTRALRTLMEELDLRDVALFCQDWGGPIGLAQAVDMPERVARLVIMNTWLHHPGYEYTPALQNWNRQWKPGGFFDSVIPERLSIGAFMMVACGFVTPADLQAHVGAGTPLPLTDEQERIRRGYAAPFESLGRAGLAGARRFPLSLPFDNPQGGNSESQAACFVALKEWTKPVHFIWGGQDEVFTERWGRQWASTFPQASFDLLPDARHFLQETHGQTIARLFLEKIGER